METRALQLLNVIVQGNILPSNCEAIKLADRLELLELKIQIEMELEDRLKKEGPINMVLLSDQKINDCITCAKVHMKSEDEPCECYTTVESTKES